MVGHGFRQAVTIGDAAADFAQHLGQSRVNALPLQNIDAAQQRHAGVEQIRELGIEGGHDPAFDLTASVPGGGGARPGRGDVDGEQPAGVQHGHRFPFRLSRQRPRAAPSCRGHGFVGILWHDSLQPRRDEG